MVLPVALGGSGVAEDEEEEEGPPANQVSDSIGFKQ